MHGQDILTTSIYKRGFFTNALHSRHMINIFYGPEPLLCTLYGAVDFLNALKKGCWWGVGGCYWYIVKYIMYL